MAAFVDLVDIDNEVFNQVRSHSCFHAFCDSDRDIFPALHRGNLSQRLYLPLPRPRARARARDAAAPRQNTG